MRNRQWQYVIKRGIWLQDCVDAYDNPDKRIMSAFSYYRKLSKRRAQLGKLILQYFYFRLVLQFMDKTIFEKIWCNIIGLFWTDFSMV